MKSHLYSFSFDLNPRWSRLWSGQQEILEYFEQCARRYRLEPNLELNTEIVSAKWDSATDMELTTAAGEESHLRHRGVGDRDVHPAGDAGH